MVHTYKKVIYDRLNDSDVKVTATNRIAELYNRKQNYFTEQRVYKYVTENGLRSDLIEKTKILASNRMYVENPCKPRTQMDLTPENFVPDSKNPIIASFFNNIGLADELGSGTKNIFKYTPIYSGKMPKMTEGDIFRIEIPLDDNYSATMDLHPVNDSNDSRNEKNNSITEAEQKNPEPCKRKSAYNNSANCRKTERFKPNNRQSDKGTVKIWKIRKDWLK